MNTDAAYKVLGINDQMDRDEIQDIIESKVFDIKQKILNPPQLPKVLEVQKERLGRLKKAVDTLDLLSDDIVIDKWEEDVAFSGLDLAENYQKFDEQKRVILLKLSNTFKIPELVNAIDHLINLIRRWYFYVYQWSKKYPQLTNFDSDITVAKAQEPVSLFKSVRVLKEKYQGVLPEHFDKNETLQPLVKECMRIIKYCSTYES